MKKIVYLLMVIGAVFTSCNPIEDINNEIDAEANPVVGEVAFTMTTEDYTDLVEQGEDDPVDFYEMFESFSDLNDAKTMLPPYLENKYPYWGEGSSADVSFNIYAGNPGDDLIGLVAASSYQLSTDDYPTAASNAFYPNEDTDSTFDAVLASQFPTPSAGDVVRIEYKRFNEEPVVGLPVVYDGLFPDVYTTYENIDVLGAQGWTEGSSYAQASGYDGSNNNDNEDWLISPEIDLSAEQSLQFQINQRISFLNGATLSDHVNILVTTNYTGDVNTTTWDTIVLNTVPDGNSSAFVLSEEYDFSAYDGQTIRIAFKFESTVANSPLWRIDYFTIKALGITGETTTKSSYFQFVNGAWQELDGIYYLSNADYDSMGESSGQPGQFNNFSGSVLPENYLPTFLDIKFPFAQEEDELFMVYKFYGGSGVGTVTRGNLYIVENGIWTPAITSLKFSFKNGVWVPDNTIRYTLVGDDYNYMSSQLITTPDFEGPAENMGNFGSFNIDPGSSNFWSEEMLVTAFDILLNNSDPNAEEGQKYILTYKIYDGSSVANRMKSLIKTGGSWVLNTEG